MLHDLSKRYRPEIHLKYKALDCQQSTNRCLFKAMPFRVVPPESPYSWISSASVGNQGFIPRIEHILKEYTSAQDCNIPLYFYWTLGSNVLPNLESKDWLDSLIYRNLVTKHVVSGETVPIGFGKFSSCSTLKKAESRYSGSEARCCIFKTDRLQSLESGKRGTAGKCTLYTSQKYVSFGLFALR